MPGGYDYEIYVEKLTSPIGGVYPYVAKVRRLVKNREVVPSQIHQIRETWGRTHKEAEAKLRTKIRAWIKQQAS